MPSKSLANITTQQHSLKHYPLSNMAKSSGRLSVCVLFCTCIPADLWNVISQSQSTVPIQSTHVIKPSNIQKCSCSIHFVKDALGAHVCGLEKPNFVLLSNNGGWWTDTLKVNVNPFYYSCCCVTRCFYRFLQFFPPLMFNKMFLLLNTNYIYIYLTKLIKWTETVQLILIAVTFGQ